MAYDWDEKALFRLRQLWLEGQLSATEIGQRLGTTKSSVIGKAHRLGLVKRPSPIRDPNLPRSMSPDAIRRRAYRQRTQPGDIIAVRRQDGTTESVSFADSRRGAVVGETLPPMPSLAPRAAKCPFFPPPGRAPEPTFILPANLSSRCCYVVDDTRMQQRYCDAPAPLGSSWCIEHARQVFVRDHFPDWCARHHVRMEVVAA